MQVVGLLISNVALILSIDASNAFSLPRLVFVYFFLLPVGFIT